MRLTACPPRPAHRPSAVILQKSILTLPRQLILCISKKKRYADQFVRELTFAKRQQKGDARDAEVTEWDEVGWPVQVNHVETPCDPLATPLRPPCDFDWFYDP